MKKELGLRVTVNAEKTDWARLRAMSDADVTFTADAPATTAQDWVDAVVHRGLPLPKRKEQIALRVDADVLARYRALGKGWQTHMNAVLRQAAPLLHA